MDIPASSKDGMGGSSGRPITRYGTTKYVPKANHSYGDGPGHGTYRNRSRSTSPRHCFDRAGLNDRVDQIASSDHRTNMSPRSRNITYKFFASGNRHYGNICWNSRSDPTSDSFNNYKLDDCTQSMDSGVYITPAREGSKGSGATLDLNVPVPYGDKYEGTSEQRGLRSSADDHAVCNNRYMAHSSSGVSVFEPRGTTVLGATIKGSMILTGNQLLKLNRSFRKPYVLDTVRSEASSSGQCLRSSEQISILIDILARILEEIKQLPELYAALSATSALKILQSYVSGSAGSDAPPAASSTQLDLVNHSLKLINSVFSEQQAEVALSSQLPRAGDPGGVGPYGTDCENVELSVNSLQSGEKDQFAKWNNEEQNLPKAGELKEREDEGKLASNEVEGNTGEKEEITDGKSLHAFRCALIEFVKELLSPTYIRDQINKDDFKITAREVVKKVISSVKSIDMPRTQENINIYLSVSGPKILELVQKYVKILKKKTGTAA